MDDAYDDDAVRLRDEEYHVRKTTSQGSPHTRMNLAVSLRHSRDGGEGCLARAQELRAETRLPILIPSERRVHFERGGGQHDIRK